MHKEETRFFAKRTNSRFQFSARKTTKTKPELKKKPSGLKKIFGSRRKSDASIIDHTAKPRLAELAPSLSQMRRFASSRDTFSNFDWTTAQIAPEVDQDYYSDEDRGYSDGEDDVIIPFSAPILGAGAGAGAGYGGGLGLEPRKEINLWKRRTMAQPKPLQLNMKIKPLEPPSVVRWFLDSTFIFINIVVQIYENKDERSYELLFSLTLYFHLITLVNNTAPISKVGIFDCLLAGLIRFVIFPVINDGKLSYQVVWIVFALYQGLKHVDEAFVQLGYKDDDKRGEIGKPEEKVE
ncbi:hypothetical protein BUALT_Bualt08G0091800 [Buddleja alternifolia]|uniref:Uncharacterized protein n=1 Tax=Buddleja alternifolia TaxID=168488 RepID=A0AAV6X6H9_9LAMI|nr:hypothetical protein BUALT_Bualt08G0091800 [Buddleja alternifolia]